MRRSADRSGTPVFCSRILDVISQEPFNLSNGSIMVHKACSIGWAPFPWCNNAVEAICAEEVIELADQALYLAKSLGRNQSVGFLPSDEAITSPERINSENLRDEQSSLIKVIKTLGQTRPHRLSDAGYRGRENKASDLVADTSFGAEEI